MRCDSYTGIEVCLMCLLPIAGEIALSPHSEGDNFKQLLEGEEE